MIPNFLIDFVFAPPTANQTDFMDMLGYINNLTDVGQGGLFFTIMLIVFAGIMFLMMRGFSTERALGVTSIITFLMAMLFKILNWVNNYVVTITAILAIFGIYLLVKESSQFDA